MKWLSSQGYGQVLAAVITHGLITVHTIDIPSCQDYKYFSADLIDNLRALNKYS